MVHRFLDWVPEQISEGVLAGTLAGAVPSWQPRILASFRAEGLPPALCIRETERALQALERTLRDPHGVWVLAPHQHARSEYSLHVEGGNPDGQGGGIVRADRTFLGGAAPASFGATHLWIVDFKTAEPGGRSLENFLAGEHQKYEPQMQAYARAMLRQAITPREVVLALFYPLIPRLLYWPYVMKNASDELNAGY